jgi:predicted DNA-binding ribbon-helix-helix protein
MTTLTIRLPEDKHERLKALARARKVSINKLIDELATVALANHDAFLRFQALAQAGDPRRAFDLLEELDHSEE